jgi:hypothetical protein
MDYGNAFVYMFSSKEWIKKMVLGTAMALVPILGQFVLIGWTLDVLRNLKQKEADPLPEWTGDDFARWLGRGLGLSVAVVTFLLPVIVVAVILWGCGAIGLSILGRDGDTLGGAFSLCMACISLILYFVIGLGALVVLVRYASTDQIDVGLEYVKNFQLVAANIAPLLIIVVLILIMMLVGAIVGILTLGVLFLVLPVYSYLILAYFGAQLSEQPGFAE